MMIKQTVSVVRPILLAFGVLALVLFPRQSVSAQTTLDFENFQPKTVIGPFRQFYGNHGVLVEPQDGVIATTPKPHSGKNVLSATETEFYAGPFSVVFTSGQTHVSFFVGATVADSNAQLTATLRVLNENGNQVAAFGAPRRLMPNECSTLYDIQAAGPVIRRIEIYTVTTDAKGNQRDVPAAIDDLTFEGGSPPDFKVPVVQITNPLSGAQLDLSAVGVHGTVSGDGLMPTVRLTLETPGPTQGGQLPPVVRIISLQHHTGNPDSFSTLLDLGVGPQRITVEASTVNGLSARAEVDFANLPKLITDRFTAGGAGPVGALNWGAKGKECTLAIYDNGAITTDGQRTYWVAAPIFRKWNQWVLAKYNQLNIDSFCPVEEERDAPGTTRAQTYRGGRIYLSAQPQVNLTYVPAVFAKTIDQLGGEKVTGVPVTDPMASPAAKTWLFQQFARPGQMGVASTLEIKGDTPTLWVERQGGDLSALKAAGQSLSDHTPTLVQQLQCDGPEGPCTFVPPTPSIYLSNAEDYCYKRWSLTPEWRPVGNPYGMITLMGIISETDVTAWGQENLATHSPPAPGTTDRNIEVVPIPPYQTLLAGNTDYIKVEVQENYVRYFHWNWGVPSPGDLILAAGRLIADCGHPFPFRVEIHPPFVTAEMRTEKGFSGPVTVANIWVNSFYNGAPIDINLFPPPRPSPNAFLFIEKPVDKQAAVDVSLSYTTDPDFFAFVRAHFSAYPRSSPISDLGEMMWVGGRVYEGRWTLGWQTQAQYQIQHLDKNWWP